VEAQETDEGIELFIDGIQGAEMDNDVMNGIKRKFVNSLNNVSRNPKLHISNCHFRLTFHEQIYQLESNVLERIAQKRSPDRPGFRSWINVAPRPVEAPASEAVPGAVMPAPGKVALALGADIANLRAGFDVANSMKDIGTMVENAMFMLETVQTYIKGLDSSSGAGAGAVAAGVAGSSSTISTPAASAGSGGQAAGPPGAGQPGILPPVCPTVFHPPTPAC